ncbi:MAG: prepilin-type N-terminal cleavage/methylation domain-containing protein [Bacteroidota bacterium]
MNEGKLSGFTLLELLVAIALTSLVFILGQYIYVAFHQFHVQYEGRVDHTYELSQIQYSLDRDLQSASIIQWEEEHVLCLKNEEEVLSHYHLYPKEISRTVEDHMTSWEVSASWELEQTSAGFLLVDSLQNLQLRFFLPAKATAKPDSL